ncbi:hypothetical protein STCU_08582 [Strigomonas culicis]|uniref:Uncharacterized protein n=1 Tax=Strigomonas culicis TaxID=28005 RepID=S9V367_9TRYP|nr:hypothetical protein STCU_08582 [Strigomonas culicis]|eukprot:EPY21351.1 hypothetical protein STCU_08582 [Strigomonas culicis]
MDLGALQVGLQSMVRNKATCSCAEMMAALHYVAREMTFLERQGTGAAPPSDLLYAKRTLADLCLERIVFFFILKAPQHSPHARPTDERHVAGGAGFGPSAATGAAPVPPSAADGVEEVPFAAAVGTADDALAALEVLTRLRLDTEASATLVESLTGDIRRLLEAKGAARDVPLSASGSGSHGKGPGEAERGVQLTHGYLVSELFYFIMISARHNHLLLSQLQRRGGDAVPPSRRHRGVLKFTSLVQCFALLRIYLPVLWPPYARERGAEGRGGTPGAPLDLRRQEWLLQRLSKFLAAELLASDSHFVNSYHFTKILNCLARLPGTVLCPEAPARPGLHSAAASRRGAAAPTAVEFWQYMVSKAVIFVSGLPPAQRRLICEQLYICVKQKRGRHFGPPQHVKGGRAAEGGGGFDQLPTAENMLFPLVAEMSQYKDNFDVCVRALRGRRDQRRSEDPSGRRDKRYTRKGSHQFSQR